MREPGKTPTGWFGGTGRWDLEKWSYPPTISSNQQPHSRGQVSSWDKQVCPGLITPPNVLHEHIFLHFSCFANHISLTCIFYVFIFTGALRLFYLPLLFAPLPLAVSFYLLPRLVLECTPSTQMSALFPIRKHAGKRQTLRLAKFPRLVLPDSFTGSWENRSFYLFTLPSNIAAEVK